MIEICSNISSSTLPYHTYFIFVAGGLSMMSLSLIPLVTIAASEKFRSQKEYVMIAANLAHEFLYGAAHLISGTHRTITYLSNTSKNLLNKSGWLGLEIFRRTNLESYFLFWQCCFICDRFPGLRVDVLNDFCWSPNSSSLAYQISPLHTELLHLLVSIWLCAYTSNIDSIDRWS